MPLLSLIVTSYNTGKFLEATMDSIFAQDFPDFECIVVDGCSTDGSLEKFKKYPKIRLISEKDSSSFEAFCKGLAMARGKYVMQCCVSDGFLARDWFSRCVEVLEEDNEVSLVWGFPQYMDEKGNLLSVSFPQFHRKPAPQKQYFFPYWLASSFWFPEGNFCIRTEVMKDCFPAFDREKFKTMEPWLEVHFNFNTQGYLPYFLPVVANYGRIHEGQLGQQLKISGVGEQKLARYLAEVREFRRKLLAGIIGHEYRDGDGRVLPYRFSRRYFWRSQVVSPERAAEHGKTFLKRTVRRIAYALQSRGLMPSFLRRVIIARRQANFSAKK